MSDAELLSEYLRDISTNFQTKFKLVHINAQSLCDSAHYSEFCSDFENSEIDVIAVSESWFKDSSVTHLPNYSVLTANRKDRVGGGVALYIKEGYKSKVLAASNGESMFPEYLVSEITVGTVKILCACIYRPPHVGHMDVFLDDLYNFLPNYKFAFVCGTIPKSSLTC